MNNDNSYPSSEWPGIALVGIPCSQQNFLVPSPILASEKNMSVETVDHKCEWSKMQ